MPRRYQFHIISFVFTLLFVTAFYPEFSYSQIESLKADSTKVEIEAVALSNIGVETENTLSTIREIRAKINPSEEEIELDSIIPQKLETVDNLKETIDLDELRNMNLRQTESQKNDFIQLRSQFDNWRSFYIKESEEINKIKGELRDIETKWEKTLATEREEALPKQVTERMQTNLNEANILLKDLSDRNNALLTKQEELTGALVYIDEVLNVISKVELSLKNQIFTIDSPFFWHMLQANEDTVSFGQKVHTIIQDHNNNLKSFSQNYKASIYYHILFFAILTILLYYLKSDVSKWSDEKKDEAIFHSLHIISQPISSALLVSLIFTRIFYPEAPESVLNFYYAAMVIPILTVLPGLIPSMKNRYFYIVGCIIVLAQLADYLSDLVILDRILLLFNDLITVILLIAILKSRKTLIEKEPKIKWRFVFAIMRIGIFLLSISLISNLLGNTVLAKILSQGSLVMIYGGIIIYASELVLKSLFALLIQHNKINQLNMIQNYPDEVKHHIFRSISILASVYWIYVSLNSFMIFDPIYLWFEELFTREYVVGSVSVTIGNILAFFITLWISLTISKLIRFILQDEILTHFDMPRGVPGAISMLVRLVLITLGFILAFGAAKIDMSNITILFGALGVGIGFGLQNIFNNLVSGLILAFERPIQVGDTIQISTLNLMGEVKEIGIRASTVRTFDGAEVIVPNGNLISNEMINWTLSDHRKRQEIIVGVAYGTDTNKVLKILSELVPEQDNVLKNPAPFVIFLGFGESSLDFRVLFWTQFSNGLGTKSAVGIAIDEAFKKEGIEIPFPQRDLHLRSVSDSVNFQNEKKPVPKVAPRKKSAGSTGKKDEK